MAQAIKGELIDLVVKAVAIILIPGSAWAVTEIYHLKQGQALLEHSYHDGEKDREELKEGQKSIKNCLIQMQLKEKCDFR